LCDEQLYARLAHDEVKQRIAGLTASAKSVAAMGNDMTAELTTAKQTKTP